MRLPEGRVGPYVRALSSGLNRLAPHGDFVPLLSGLAHLRALDPALSGDLLAPAEVHDQSGMPAFTWMQRAISEARLSSEGNDPTDADIERASRLDPDLGKRLAHRRGLRQHLREHQVLPVTRLECALQRLGSHTEVKGAYDRLAPDGRWLRIRFLVRASGSHKRLGPFAIDATHEKLTDVDPGLQHLLTRHFATRLLGLRAQLEDGIGAPVVRLTRGWIGPFWFPGIQLPPGVPEALGGGLVLNLSSEVVADDVLHPAHRDPLVQADSAAPPDGLQIFRERRFAASSNLLDPLTTFCEQAGMRCPIAPIDGRRQARRL